MISTANLVRLPAFIAGSCDVNAIVDTPQGSQSKFKFDEQTGLFALDGAMPAGSVFPFEFGFIPSTAGGDGDPLDLLILLDAPTFVGCLVRTRSSA
jgi:inorganic pyrophosphatase